MKTGIVCGSQAGTAGATVLMSSRSGGEGTRVRRDAGSVDWRQWWVSDRFYSLFSYSPAGASGAGGGLLDVVSRGKRLDRVLLFGEEV